MDKNIQAALIVSITAIICVSILAIVMSQPQKIVVGTCGNGVCDSTESCSSCPEDCGACPEPVNGIVAWQTGVFNPQGGTAPGMSGFGNVRPSEFYCSSGTIRVVVVNAAGQTISNLQMQDMDCTKTGIAAGESTECIAAQVPGCIGVSRGDRYEVNLEFTYTTAGGLGRTSAGTIWGPAE
jgi:hypothetical protein